MSVCEREIEALSERERGSKERAREREVEAVSERERERRERESEKGNR